MRGAGRLLPAALLIPLLLLGAFSAAGGPPAGPQAARAAYLFVLPPMSYEEALRRPPLAALGSAGGVGLMTTLPAPDRTPEETLVDGGAEPGTLERFAAEAQGELVVVRDADERDVERLLGQLNATPSAEEVLVLAAPPQPSAAMEARGDAVTPLFVAGRTPDRLAAGSEAIRGLASDTTRREGVVANVDVAPTILAFLGAPVPTEMAGSPVRVEGPAPDELHRRYLEVRELRIPVQVGTLALALALLLAGTAFVLARGRSPSVAAIVSVGALVTVMLPAAFLPVGDLPRIVWWTAMPVAALVAALVVGTAVLLGRADPTIPVAVVGAASASIVVLDALLGWRASMLPLFGGTALEGARFFGLGNLHAGILLAGVVLTAAHLPPGAGVGVIAGAALFAGLPWLGSNLGAAVTLFAAAGLWFGLRMRRRLGPVELGAAAAIAIAGGAAIVAVHALFAAGETHVARITAEAGRTGASAILDALGRRAAIALRVTSEVPPAWLLLAALPGLAVVAGRRWGYLARDTAWRDAVVVLCAAGLVGFVANDTGIGVAGTAFAFAATAVGYPALEERWRSA